MNRFAEKFIDGVFRHPILIISISAVLFILSAIILPSLHIDNSVDVFFNKKGDAYINFQEWKKQFGTDERIIVALSFNDVFYSYSLEQISNLSEQFEQIPYVEDVMSLTTVNTTIGDERDFIVERLIEEIPQDKQGLADLKKVAINDPLYVKNVVSSDGKVAAIIVELQEQHGEGKDDSYKKKVITQIEDILKAQENFPKSMRYYISGLTAIEYYYASYMQEDFKAFMPFLFLMIIAVMYISFRSIKLVALSLFSIMISVACSMALLHLLGFSVNNVTTIIPPILMAIMIADSVHVIGEALQRKKQERDDDGVFLKETMRHLMFPCLLTTATTAVGFWSLSLSEIPPVRQLGIVVGCGVFIALIVTFTFLPMLAKVWSVFSVKQKRSNGGDDRFGRVLRRIAEVNERHYKLIVAISVVIVGLSIWGVSKIEAETSVIEYFRKSTPIYRSTIFIEENLSGVHTLNISMRSGQIDYFKDPSALHLLEDVTEFLSTIPEVDKVSSVNDYLKEINKSFHAEDGKFYRIPENRRMVAQYVLLYGREDMEDFMDDQWQWATIRVRLKEHSTVKLAGVLERINDYLTRYRSEFESVEALGQTVLEVETNNMVANGQMKSLGLAMLVIFGMMFLVFRSISVGFISMVPNVLPILMNFGVMGFCGVKLDSATSMIAAVGIGIVVDDTIHFLHGYGEALAERKDHVQAMYQTLQQKGRPIVLTSAILFFGFGVLSISKFMPTAYFGMLSALLMVNALIADLFILPSILILLKPEFRKVKSRGDSV